jgi:hypothetical protein
VLRLAPGHEKKSAAPIAVGAAPDCRVVIAKSTASGGFAVLSSASERRYHYQQCRWCHPQW